MSGASEVPADGASLIAEAITEHWGHRCPDYDASCDCCRAWAEFDRLARPVDTGREKALEDDDHAVR